MRKPHRLEMGSRIAVVAPASPFDRKSFDEGIAELEQVGLVPTWEIGRASCRERVLVQV